MKMAITTDNLNEKNAEMRERLPSVPTRPGVYLFKDTSSKFLYVGKAANLRNRLRSYFASPYGTMPKTRRLMQQAVDFEFVKRYF